jgi:hypothetical protein
MIRFFDQNPLCAGLVFAFVLVAAAILTASCG